MHAIVVGCGRVGSGLALALEERGHTVAIIDKSRNAFRRMAPGFGGERLVGLGFDRDTLVTAGVERAQLFASVTSGDNSNILSARIAKETFQIPNVVARIYDPRRAEIYQRLGIATVATVSWTTDQMLRRLFPETRANWSDSSGVISLVERTLPDVWAGHRLADLGDPERVRVVAVGRGGASAIAGPDVIGQEGDVLHVLVHASALAAFEDRLAAGPGGH